VGTWNGLKGTGNTEVQDVRGWVWISKWRKLTGSATTQRRLLYIGMMWEKGEGDNGRRGRHGMVWVWRQSDS
jgi:hypothetical protein